MKQQQVFLHKACRACRGPLHEVMNLGNLRLNTFPAHTWEIDQIQAVPLILAVCRECGLCQLDRTVPPDWMYRSYWYRSSVNESMVAELRSIVLEATTLRPVNRRNAVLDIGANDGTLLKAYADLLGEDGPLRVAVEPAQNLQEALHAHAEVVVNDYFPGTTGAPALARTEAYSIITIIACAYDTEDPLLFFQEVRRLLAPGGVVVIQFQDLAQQLQSAAFDNICHEHLEYYTLWSLSRILNQCGLGVIDVRQSPINGGSLRVFAAPQADTRRPHSINLSVQFNRELRLGLDTPSLRRGDLTAFSLFNEVVARAKRQIHAVLEQTIDEGRIIDIYGASTKGNTLLQVMGIDDTVARQAIDRSPAKWGHYTLTGIPIVGEEQAREQPADVWFTPIWQFRNFMLDREQWYLDQGGTVIFPLPRVEVVRGQVINTAERD